jgi:hypothetical protein
MNDSSENEADMKELNHEMPLGSVESDGTNISMRDPDTILSMIVLLLSCLALAALAHVFV